MAPINQPKNRGTGAGGKNTNVNGKKFEKQVFLPNLTPCDIETGTGMPEAVIVYKYDDNTSITEQNKLYHIFTDCPQAKVTARKKKAVDSKRRNDLRGEFNKKTTAEMLSFLSGDEETEKGKKNLFVRILEVLEKNVPKDENKERLRKLEYSPDFDELSTYEDWGLEEAQVRKVLSSVFYGRTLLETHIREPDMAVLYWKPNTKHNCVSNLLALDIMEAKSQNGSGSVTDKLVISPGYWGDCKYKAELVEGCGCEHCPNKIKFRYSMTLCDWFRGTSVINKRHHVDPKHWSWMDDIGVKRFWGEDPNYLESVKKYIEERRVELCKE